MLASRRGGHLFSGIFYYLYFASIELQLSLVEMLKCEQLSLTFNCVAIVNGLTEAIIKPPLVTVATRTRPESRRQTADFKTTQL